MQPKTCDCSKLLSVWTIRICLRAFNSLLKVQLTTTKHCSLMQSAKWIIRTKSLGAGLCFYHLNYKLYELLLKLSKVSVDFKLLKRVDLKPMEVFQEWALIFWGGNSMKHFQLLVCMGTKLMKRMITMAPYPLGSLAFIHLILHARTLPKIKLKTRLPML